MNKRNRLLSAAVGAALAAGTMGVSTSPAWADAITLGIGNFPNLLCPPGCSGDFNRTVGPGFSQLPDTYSFEVTADLNLSASARNHFDNANELITGFTLTLWQGTPDPLHAGDTLVATAAPQEIVGSFNLAGTLNAVVHPGSYYLEVFGVQPFVVTGYNGSFEFSPVAIPGPVAGAGLPGLVMACGGLLAWTRRRKQAA
jgi:hypothetical protein